MSEHSLLSCERQLVNLPLVSLVLPNFNGRELLEKNLPSALQALSLVPFEIIVVDDASEDNSVSFLLKNYPSIRVVRHEKNKGFSETCNAGIRHSIGKYICVSNTDVMFDPEYFRFSLELLETENVFAVKGKIRNYDPHSGAVINDETTAVLFQKRGLLRFDKSGDNSPGIMEFGVGKRFALLGCCFVARSDQLKGVGGFDTIYSPFYWEDSDLPLRAMKLGYQILYVPDAVVYHQLSSTINRFRSKYWRKLVSDRNKFIFSWRYLSGARQWINHIFSVVFGLFFRWIRLDHSYYLGFFWALYRWISWPRKG